jgi:hypothetical protein
VSSNRLTCVDEYAKGLKDGDKEVLLDILRKDSSYEFNEQERKFNATKYYLSYLESDVDVLQQSMIKYREMMYELTHLDVWDSLTCSSFANKYAASQGCFEGSFQVKGGLRDFMQGAVRGGRVFVGVKIDGQHSAVRETDQLTQALDANSLYPSAIERLCNEYGIPVGMAKVGTEQTYEYYQSKDWYTVKIRVLAIRKSQPVPCISVTRNVVIDGKPTTRVQYVNDLTVQLNSPLIKSRLRIGSNIMLLVSPLLKESTGTRDTTKNLEIWYLNSITCAVNTRRPMKQCPP